MVTMPVTNNAVAVSNGLFTTLVDFGPGIFTGGSNWLEIAVRTNATGSFLTLAPRQQLTPTPYALYAATASNLSGTISAGQLTGALTPAQLPAGHSTDQWRGRCEPHRHPERQRRRPDQPEPRHQFAGGHLLYRTGLGQFHHGLHPRPEQ